MMKTRSQRRRKQNYKDEENETYKDEENETT